jgi:hypothetical protein
VVYQGKPAENALVVFHPADAATTLVARPSGRVGADGSFQLSTYLTNDGAPAGEYVVVIIWPVGRKPGTAVDAGEGPDRLENRYSNPQTSRWRIRLREGKNELEPFELE